MGMSDGKFVCKIAMMQSVFEGKIGNNEIVGELKHPAMANSPSDSITLKKGEYVAQVHKLTLPKEVTDKLLGEWNGPLTMQGMSITVVFRFEMSKNNEFVGFQDSPDQKATGIPITEASLSDGKLTLKVASLNGEFKGQLSGDKLDGEWTQMGMKNPLSLKKGKYVAPVYKLNLPKETMNKLTGKWTGKFQNLTVVFRFEKSKNGDFLGYTDSPDQGGSGIPVTEASYDNGKLTLKVSSIGAEYEGKLSDNKLDGTLTQMGMKNSLSLTKEKP
jgi:hypothetical protein